MRKHTGATTTQDVVFSLRPVNGDSPLRKGAGDSDLSAGWLAGHTFSFSNSFIYPLVLPDTLCTCDVSLFFIVLLYVQ